MPQLTIHLFGYPQFLRDETPLKVERRKTLALLAYLARAPGCAISRETITGLLWPNAPQDQAAAYLRQALWDFNKAAGEGWIEREGPTVQLRGALNVRVDVQRFEEITARWKQAGQPEPGRLDARWFPLLEEAAGLYSADFLAGFSLRGSPEFETWQTLQAESLRLQLGAVLEALSNLYARQEKYEPAVACALRWLSLDELNENAHRMLMRLYDDSGQRSAAYHQYEACQRRLQEELGVSPEPETIQLFQDISARRAAPTGAGKAARAAPRSRGGAPARPPVPVFLPAQATPFLGREPELARIRELLGSPDCRLITLVGPGGSGKTRLAVQCAGQNIGYPHGLNFPHGIYFVGLAGATNPREAVQGIAGALKLELRGDLQQGISTGAAREQLFSYLAEKSALLVLDNLEQLAEYTLFSDLLSGAPGVKLVATSRIRLNLPEEWVLEVGGLPFPTPTQPGEDAETLQRYASVQLFLRSAAKAASFSPQAGDWPAIARICQMVEGLPLGVEFAAAWVKMLSCHEIVAEITRSLDFLETSHPGTPQRQRSLRAVFEHSWSLLKEDERAVFQRLSVFKGGFTREAAFQVAGAMLSVLSAFVDQSMLRRVSSGRFDLHELVKQYAAEKLAGDPRAQAETQARHAQYYMGLLLEKGAALRGRDQLSALALLRGETQNLRSAWRWLVAQRQYAQIEPVLADFILFHEMQGEYSAGSEMMQTLAAAIQQDDPHRPPAQETSPAENTLPQDGSILQLLSLAQATIRHFKRADPSFTQGNLLQQESIALARSLPQTHTRAFILILNSTGSGLLSPEQVIAMCRESAEIFQATGDPWGGGLAQLVLGDTWMFAKNDPVQARAAYETGMAIFDQLSNDWGRALCFFGLAAVARNTGKRSDAAHLIRQSMRIYEQMGNISRLLETRDIAGRLAAETGDKETARQYFAANQTYLDQVGDHRGSRHYTERIAALDME